MSTPAGHWHMKVMTMGLKNSGPQFQRQMDHVLRHLPFAHAYVDDVCISSESMELAMLHTRQVLDALQAAHIVVKGSKMQLLKRTVQLLGHVVSGATDTSPTGVSPQEEKVKNIRDWPVPKTVREGRSFLGLAGYYRRFVWMYTAKSLPLTQLTKK